MTALKILFLGIAVLIKANNGLRILDQNYVRLDELSSSEYYNHHSPNKLLNDIFHKVESKRLKEKKREGSAENVYKNYRNQDEILNHNRHVNNMKLLELLKHLQKPLFRKGESQNSLADYKHDSLHKLRNRNKLNLDDYSKVILVLDSKSDLNEKNMMEISELISSLKSEVRKKRSQRYKESLDYYKSRARRRNRNDDDKYDVYSREGSSERGRSRPKIRVRSDLGGATGTARPYGGRQSIYERN